MERATRQKLAIRTAIDTARRPLMPQEVLEDARLQVPTLSIATVYRNLKAPLQDGAIHLVAMPGASPRYDSPQAASTTHHHSPPPTPAWRGAGGGRRGRSGWGVIN